MTDLDAVHFLPVAFGLAVTKIMQHSESVPYGVLVSSFSHLLFSAINYSASQTGPAKQRNWKFWM